ncbi:hypothetical protein [Neosynechococcus sphagnicola]|uniref:hypothetical protein n=1 Tax=Neosynechococcus sphagnicola TaxID=1501145 RepID=UPI0012E064C3
MPCPECNSTHTHQNSLKKSKQNHIYVDCGRQFIGCYETTRGYRDEVKRECLKMDVNVMGFRGSERVKGIHTFIQQRRQDILQIENSRRLLIDWGRADDILCDIHCPI